MERACEQRSPVLTLVDIYHICAMYIYIYIRINIIKGSLGEKLPSYGDLKMHRIQ